MPFQFKKLATSKANIKCKNELQLDNKLIQDN